MDNNKVLAEHTTLVCYLASLHELAALYKMAKDEGQ